MSRPDRIAELKKLGPGAADRLAAVRDYLATPAGRKFGEPMTADEVEFLERRMAQGPGKSVAERIFPNGFGAGAPGAAQVASPGVRFTKATT